MTEDSTILSWALRYHRAGWPIFPCQNKKPLSKALEAWEGSWQSAIEDGSVNEDTIRWWWKQYPDAQIAVACGRKANLTVVDVDTETDARRHPDYVIKDCHELVSELPPSLTSITGSGGRHVLYAFADIPNSAKTLHPQIDIRSEGGYIILPPSPHPSGNKYRWLDDWDDTAPSRLTPFPSQLLRNRHGARDDRDWLRITQGVGTGSRNMSAAKLAGLLVRKLEPHIAWDLLKAWNTSNNQPPLPAEELSKTFNSILRMDYEKTTRRNR